MFSQSFSLTGLPALLLLLLHADVSSAVLRSRSRMTDMGNGEQVTHWALCALLSIVHQAMPVQRVSMHGTHTQPPPSRHTAERGAPCGPLACARRAL
jgi:hypothetical protein